jgi:hypothetical protein
MDLMWAFMGYSTTYNMFLGLSEALGGALLFFRRTTTLGALITSGIMLQVFLLNVSYGVCVKLMSAHLLLMAIALAIPDARRLLDAVVLGRAVPSRDDGRPVFGRRVTLALRVGKWVLIAGALALSLSIAWRNWHRVGAPAPRSALQGIWDADPSSRSEPAGGAVAQTEANRWKLLAIDSPTEAVVRRVDDRSEELVLRVDEASKTLTLTSRGSELGSTFTYEQPSADELVLAGDRGGGPVSMRFTRRDLTPLLLLSQRLKWTSDLP